MADPDPDSEKKADTDSDPGKKIWIRNTVFMDLDPESGESLIQTKLPGSETLVRRCFTL